MFLTQLYLFLEEKLSKLWKSKKKKKQQQQKKKKKMFRVGSEVWLGWMRDNFCWGVPNVGEGCILLQNAHFLEQLFLLLTVFFSCPWSIQSKMEEIVVHLVTFMCTSSSPVSFHNSPVESNKPTGNMVTSSTSQFSQFTCWVQHTYW